MERRREVRDIVVRNVKLAVVKLAAVIITEEVLKAVKARKEAKRVE